MGTKKLTTAKTEIQDMNTDQTVEVLYQKMGDRWFAFSLVGDEVFVGSIRQEEIDSNELDDAIMPPKGLPGGDFSPNA